MIDTADYAYGLREHLGLDLSVELRSLNAIRWVPGSSRQHVIPGTS